MAVGLSVDAPGYTAADDSAGRQKENKTMGVILFVLLLALLLGGLGFAAHVLWWIAAIVFIGWLLGFGMRSGEGRWYRW